QLERAVGATLLVRTSRGVGLTRAGDELAAGVKPLLTDLDALIDRVQASAQGRAGRLRLVCKPHATAEFALEVVRAMERAAPGGARTGRAPHRGPVDAGGARPGGVVRARTTGPLLPAARGHLGPGERRGPVLFRRGLDARRPGTAGVAARRAGSNADGLGRG